MYYMYMYICCHMCYMYLTSACVYMDGTETTFRTYMACVRTDLCPPGPHRAAGEVCLSPGDGVGAGDSSGGDGETAQPVRMWCVVCVAPSMVHVLLVCACQ